jgi:hypothetical protein
VTSYSDSAVDRHSEEHKLLGALQSSHGMRISRWSGNRARDSGRLGRQLRVLEVDVWEIIEHVICPKVLAKKYIGYPKEGYYYALVVGAAAV